MKTLTLIKVFWRSFLIQSVWNFERMQNVGFAFAILPALKESHPKGYMEKIGHHLGFFNTHPYMASHIIGAVINMEENDEDKGEIESFKRGFMGPYAAIGDSFFWGALKPFASTIGLLFAIKGSFLAPFIFLLIYNIPHIWIRFNGLLKGYIRGKYVGETIRDTGIYQWTERIRFLTIILLSLLLLFIAFSFGKSKGIEWNSGFSFSDLSLLSLLTPLFIVLFTCYLLGKGLTLAKVIYLYIVLLGALVIIVEGVLL